MSTITDSLRKLAEGISESSAWGQIKEAAFKELVNKGVKDSDAHQMLGNLEQGVTKTASCDGEELSAILLKVASYIDELETKIRTSETDLSEKDSQLAKVAEQQMMGAMSSFIDKGFSEDEVRSLSNLPEETLQKLAHNVQMAPLPLGQGAGMATDSMDPLLAFCMS